jgi:hypothetical protein
MSIPTAGLAYITPTVPGQPVNALDASLSGGYILNPSDAPGPLYIDPTGPAAVQANGTTSALQPGQTFFAIEGSTLPVSVASLFASHQFVCVQWK